MPWVRIDDHFDEHEKHVAAGPLGTALWVAGLAYANRNLTNGFIPWAKARSLVSWQFLMPPDEQGRQQMQTISLTSGMAGIDVDSDFVIGLLVDVGLWETVHGGYQIHNYEEYQPLKEDVERKRELKTKRQQRWRESWGPAGASQDGTVDASTDGTTDASTDGTTDASIDGAVVRAPNPVPNPNPNPLPEESSSLRSEDLSDSSTDERVGPLSRKKFLEAFAAWRATLPEEARSRVQPTAQRQSKYNGRIRDGYSHEQILAAVTNYVHDPWEKRTTEAKARDFATLLRDGGQVEKFGEMRPGDRSISDRPIDRGFEVPISHQAQDMARKLYERAESKLLEDSEMERLADELRAAQDSATPLEALREVRKAHGL